MYSSLSVSKHFILISFLAIQLFLINNVLSLNTTNAYLNHKCLVSEGTYKPGSIYDKGLTHSIRSIARTSYEFNMIVDETLAPEWETQSTNVTVLLQCRGDSYGFTKCRDCYFTAIAGLRRRCPSYKAGMIWYDQCLLAFSSIDSADKLDYENNFCMTNAKNVGGDVSAFEVSWKTLISNLSTIAYNVKNRDLYAVGERKFKNTKLYGLVQCTRDLSHKGCEVCLAFISKRFQDCLRNKRGGRVIGRSCGFRFEFYPFITKNDSKYFKS